jgi:signal transduction histidine kinase
MVPEPGQMLSLLSHELRSPLGVVRGYLRLLDQHQAELSAHDRQAVTAALRASERCVDLLAQASALAQLWRQETPVKRQPIALHDLLPPLAGAVAATDGQQRPVEVAPPPAGSIDGDRALLQTALTSLVAAVHRAQPVPVTVAVSCRRERKSDDDEGVSILIAPATAATAAEPEAPLDLRRGGLGLDLPMAAAIVDAHRGTIRERRSEARTSVVVWLPGGTGNEERRTKNVGTKNGNEERERRTGNTQHGER